MALQEEEEEEATDEYSREHSGTIVQVTSGAKEQKRRFVYLKVSF